MLDPDLVLSALVSVSRSNTDLVTQLGGDPTLITGHYFFSGTENALVREIYSMSSPSILIAYKDIVGGNFNGATIWKHRFEVYYRTKNAAMGGVGPNGTPPPACSASHLWWLHMNRPVLGGPNHIRAISIVEPYLYLMDTPSVLHNIDEEQQDFFVSALVFPEAGDTE